MMDAPAISARGFFVEYQPGAVFKVTIVSKMTFFATLVFMTQPRVWVNTSHSTALEGTHSYTVSLLLMHDAHKTSSPNMYDMYFKTCRYAKFGEFKVVVTTPKLPRTPCVSDALVHAGYHRVDSASRFPYTLKTRTCTLRRFDATQTKRCLRRGVLNIGSSVALNLHQGIEAKLFGKIHSTRTVGNAKDLLVPNPLGQHFTTMYIHHPYRYGLWNVLDPSYVAGREKRLGLANASRYLDWMCSFETVVFESGLHDFGLPLRNGTQTLINHCYANTCTDDFVLANVKNESWRIDLYAAYRRNLVRLARMWHTCRRTKPSFRPIFKLAMSPHLEACPPPKETQTKWTFNEDPWIMYKANRIAKHVMGAHGFEIFDPFAVGMSAKKEWYDAGGNDHQHSQRLSEILADSFLTLACRPSTTSGSDALRDL